MLTLFRRKIKKLTLSVTPEGRSCCVGRVEPLRSLLPVRYGKVEVMKNILVPMSFLQVRESSRCSLGFCVKCFYVVLRGN